MCLFTTSVAASSLSAGESFYMVGRRERYVMTSTIEYGADKVYFRASCTGFAKPFYFSVAASYIVEVPVNRPIDYALVESLGIDPLSL